MGDGEVPAKEYDYLLTMPLWSLSEEKVAELNRQLDEKKDDHDELEATHIHTLWDRDLDALLEVLQKQEELDERDRLAHKGRAAGNDGAKKAPKRRAKPVAQDEEVKFGGPAKGGKAAAGKENQGPNKNQQETMKKRQPGEKPAKAAPKKMKAAKEQEATSQPAKEPAELSLRERLALRAQAGVDKVPS